MEYGVHLPLIGFADGSYSLDHLLRYTSTAEALGYQTLCANDHLVFSKPWLDGPTAMAAVNTRIMCPRLTNCASARGVLRCARGGFARARPPWDRPAFA